LRRRNSVWSYVAAIEVEMTAFFFVAISLLLVALVGAAWMNKNTPKGA